VCPHGPAPKVYEASGFLAAHTWCKVPVVLPPDASFEDYLAMDLPPDKSAEVAPPGMPLAARERGGKHSKEQMQRYSSRCWLARGHPLSLAQLIPLLDVVATGNKHFAQAAAFLRRFPSDVYFPVRVQVGGPLLLLEPSRAACMWAAYAKHACTHAKAACPVPLPAGAARLDSASAAGVQPLRRRRPAERGVLQSEVGEWSSTKPRLYPARLPRPYRSLAATVQIDSRREIRSSRKWRRCWSLGSELTAPALAFVLFPFCMHRSVT
jgi:hypothetical protein